MQAAGGDSTSVGLASSSSTTTQMGRASGLEQPHETKLGCQLNEALGREQTWRWLCKHYHAAWADLLALACGCEQRIVVLIFSTKKPVSASRE